MSHIEDGEAAGVRASPRDRLVWRIDCDDGVHVDEDGDVMAGVTARRDGEIGDGAREDVEVFGKGGREEGCRELNTRGLEFVDRVGGHDLEAELFHRRNILGILAHEAVRLAVDAGDAIDGLALAGPMGGVAVGEMVGVRPDAEVGVVGDEGYGGRALLGGCDGCDGEERENAKKGCERVTAPTGGIGIHHHLVRMYGLRTHALARDPLVPRNQERTILSGGGRARM